MLWPPLDEWVLLGNPLGGYSRPNFFLVGRKINKVKKMTPKKNVKIKFIRIKHDWNPYEKTKANLILPIYPSS